MVLMTQVSPDDLAVTHPVIFWYDPERDRWTPFPRLDFPAGLEWPVAFMSGPDVYMMFTRNGIPASSGNAFYRFRFTDGTLQELPTVPGVARSFAFGFTDGRYGFIGGGLAPDGSNAWDVWRFDPQKVRWERIENLPQGVRRAQAWQQGGSTFVGFGIGEKPGKLPVWKLVISK